MKKSLAYERLLGQPKAQLPGSVFLFAEAHSVGSFSTAQQRARGRAPSAAAHSSPPPPTRNPVRACSARLVSRLPLPTTVAANQDAALTLFRSGRFRSANQPTAKELLERKRFKLFSSSFLLLRKRFVLNFNSEWCGFSISFRGSFLVARLLARSRHVLAICGLIVLLILIELI